MSYFTHHVFLNVSSIFVLWTVCSKRSNFKYIHVCVIKRNVHQSFIVSNNIIQFMHYYIVSQVQKTMLLEIQKHASSDYTVSFIQQSTQRARRKVNVSLPLGEGVRACAHSGDYIVSVGRQPYPPFYYMTLHLPWHHSPLGWCQLYNNPEWWESTAI